MRMVADPTTGVPATAGEDAAADSDVVDMPTPAATAVVLLHPAPQPADTRTTAWPMPNNRTRKVRHDVVLRFL